LEVLTTHVLDQHRQVQLATARHFKLVSRLTFFNAQGHVVQKLLLQTLFDVATGDVLAFFTGERRIIDLERHGYGRLVYSQRRQCFHIAGVTQGVRDEQLIQTTDADDIARLGLFNFHTLHARVSHDLEDTTVALVAVRADGRTRRVRFTFTAG